MNFGSHPGMPLNVFNQPKPMNPYNLPNTQVNIHVHSADPKAVVDAVTKYVKSNGSVPSAWGTGNRH